MKEYLEIICVIRLVVERNIIKERKDQCNNDMSKENSYKKMAMFLKT